MIRPVAFRMNEQTAVNNYYQKVLDGLSPETVNAKAQAEFDAFVTKLRKAGVNVTVVEDTLEPNTPDSIFPNNWISFHENGDVVLYPIAYGGWRRYAAYPPYRAGGVIAQHTFRRTGLGQAL